MQITEKMNLGSHTFKIEEKLRKHKKELEWNLDSKPHRWDSNEAKKANEKGHHWDSYEAKAAAKKRWKNDSKRKKVKIRMKKSNG